MTKPKIRSEFYPVIVGLLTLAVFVALVQNESLWDHVLLHLHYKGFYFVDWYAVTAAADAYADGYQVFQHSPYDYMQRPHVYSGLWLYHSFLGIDRFDGIYFAFGMVILFVVSLSLLLAPKTKRELVLAFLVAACPPFLLGMERANNDLFIFLMIASIPLFLRMKTAGLVINCTIIAIATMLKYYPAILLPVIFAFYGFNKKSITCVSVATIAAAAQILIAGELLGPLQKTMPDPRLYFTFGGENLFFYLRLPPEWQERLNIIFFLALAVPMTLLQLTKKHKSNNSDAPRLSSKEALFIIGALTVVGCFILRSGFSYRLIFCAFSVPLIFEFLKARPKIAWSWIGLFLVIAYLETIVYNAIAVIQLISGFDSRAVILPRLYKTISIFQWLFVAVYLYLAIELVVSLLPTKTLQTLLGSKSQTQAAN